MKRLVKVLSLFFILLLNIAESIAQEGLSKNTIKLKQADEKPIIDSTAIKNWISINKKGISISNDGKYFSYILDNYPINKSTFIVQAVDSSWKKELINIRSGVFSSDSKSFIYLYKDTLRFLSLGSSTVNVIEGVGNYKTPKLGDGKWLAYQLKSKEQLVVLVNLITGEETRFENTVDYAFDDIGSVFLFKELNYKNGQKFTALRMVNLDGAGISNVWSSSLIGNQDLKLINYVIDSKSKQVALLISDSSKGTHLLNYSIWCYKFGMNNAIMRISKNTPGIDSGLIVDASSVPKFTKDGRYIFFLLKNVPVVQTVMTQPIKVDVWNYRDSLLQSIQLDKVAAGENIRSYLAAFRVADLDSNVNERVIRVLHENEQMFSRYTEITGDFCIVKYDNSGDRFWKRLVTYSLVSLKDGSRKNLCTTKRQSAFYWLSPGAKFLLSYEEDGVYYSYDISTGHKVNISSKILTDMWVEDEYFKNYNQYQPVGVAGWLKDANSVLVYDNYDIWSVDLTAHRPPVNISNGYGRAHHIKFRLIDEDLNYGLSDTLLVSIFDPSNKYNGFYQLPIVRSKNFESPKIGPWTFFYNTSSVQANVRTVFDNGMEPIKSKLSHTWIVLRQNAVEAPNLFITQDFKNYKALTDIHPQKLYNWLRAELVHWPQLDGTIGQGILYKPENFDPHKKYPLLIYYYEFLSGRLNQYPPAEFTTRTEPNIPWFVSRGYLVFTPDIYYTRGKPVQSVCNTVVSAAKYFSRYSFLDPNKIGISGFSWGGHQTNWLITQTNIFAAAATGGGASDEISKALQLSDSRGKITDDQLAGAEGHMGSTIWDRPDLWLNISPVLRANRIVTPLLILYNRSDIGWQQGAELFMALRRLDKRAWMLQYDRWGHGVYEKDAEDFTIRLTQYFDHYLKDMPAPKWMTQGINASMKGIELGYEFDPAGSCAMNGATTCKVCNKWNDQYKKAHSNIYSSGNASKRGKLKN